MASIWKLPVIFICENNLYGMTTNVERVTSVKDIAVRGAAYDIPGVVVDGNDVFSVEKAFKKALKRAKAAMDLPSSRLRPIDGRDTGQAILRCTGAR